MKTTKAGTDMRKTTEIGSERDTDAAEDRSLASAPVRPALKPTGYGAIQRLLELGLTEAEATACMKYQRPPSCQSDLAPDQTESANTKIRGARTNRVSAGNFNKHSERPDLLASLLVKARPTCGQTQTQIAAKHHVRTTSGPYKGKTCPHSPCAQSGAQAPDSSLAHMLETANPPVSNPERATFGIGRTLHNPHSMRRPSECRLGSTTWGAGTNEGPAS